MKKSLVLLALISFSSFADTEAKLLLSCQDKFSGLDKIEFYQARDGRVFGVQYGTSAGKSTAEEFKVNPIAFERKKEIELFPWYGYSRELSHVNGSEWKISYQDECSGGSMLTICTEYK